MSEVGTRGAALQTFEEEAIRPARAGAAASGYSGRAGRRRGRPGRQIEDKARGQSEGAIHRARKTARLLIGGNRRSDRPRPYDRALLRGQEKAVSDPLCRDCRERGSYVKATRIIGRP